MKHTIFVLTGLPNIGKTMLASKLLKETSLELKPIPKKIPRALTTKIINTPMIEYVNYSTYINDTQEPTVIRFPKVLYNSYSDIVAYIDLRHLDVNSDYLLTCDIEMCDELNQIIQNHNVIILHLKFNDYFTLSTLLKVQRKSLKPDYLAMCKAFLREDRLLKQKIYESAGALTIDGDDNKQLYEYVFMYIFNHRYSLQSTLAENS